MSICLELMRYEPSLQQSLFEFTDACFAELGKKFEPDGRHLFYRNIPENFDSFFCLVDGGPDGNGCTVKGSVGIKRIDSDTCELKALYVSQELRGQGFGQRLLSTAINSARDLGYRRIVLDSMSQYVDARRLYEKTGFVDIERYNDNPYADVFMGLDL